MKLSIKLPAKQSLLNQLEGSALVGSTVASSSSTHFRSSPNRARRTRTRLHTSPRLSEAKLQRRRVSFSVCPPCHDLTSILPSMRLFTLLLPLLPLASVVSANAKSTHYQTVTKTITIFTGTSKAHVTPTPESRGGGGNDSGRTIVRSPLHDLISSNIPRHPFRLQVGEELIVDAPSPVFRSQVGEALIADARSRAWRRREEAARTTGLSRRRSRKRLPLRGRRVLVLWSRR